MLFNSLAFAWFFPLVTIVYYVTPRRYRWAPLLLASCYFYMAFIPIYILILIGLILLDYSAGILIEPAVAWRRRALLVASLTANLGILGIFKYARFADENFANLATFLHWSYSLHALSLALPLGVSFHTFQSMSYTIEVYRGTVAAERNLGYYALYVMFYPQLVAGPIERPHHLLPQLRRPHELTYENVASGLKRMTWGMFKKVVVADRLAALVNVVFAAPRSMNGVMLCIGVLFFSFQIYCDFSGYSDIAIGAARVMGIELAKNFERPYAARSLREFWHRWHISLSTWFRDYVYIPLGGNRAGRLRRIANLLIVFLLSGLWHGANWTFVVWGGLHGVIIALSQWSAAQRDHFVRATGLALHPLARHVSQTTLTFALVSLAWIFFRSASVRDALYIAAHLGDHVFSIAGWQHARETLSSFGLRTRDIIFGLSLIVILQTVEGLQANGLLFDVLRRRPAPLRLAAYASLVVAILDFGVRSSVPFVYFQF